jgi:hypothetical protein
MWRVGPFARTAAGLIPSHNSLGESARSDSCQRNGVTWIRTKAMNECLMAKTSDDTTAAVAQRCSTPQKTKQTKPSSSLATAELKASSGDAVAELHHR